MKIIIIILLFCAFAQEGMCSDRSSLDRAGSYKYIDIVFKGADTPRMHDYVMIQAGKVLLVKNKKGTPLKTDITMQDGSIVRMDGTLITKDGKTYILHEGDKVYMSGIVEAPKLQ